MEQLEIGAGAVAEAVAEAIDHHIAACPKLTQEDIEAEIAEESYFTAAHGVEGAVSKGELHAHYRVPVRKDAGNLGTVTFCVLVLRNGTKIVGINYGPVNPANFDAAEGRQRARDHAVEQVWPLLGYSLRETLRSLQSVRDLVASAIAPAAGESIN